jgi:hypothetical protein
MNGLYDGSKMRWHGIYSQQPATLLTMLLGDSLRPVLSLQLMELAESAHVVMYTVVLHDCTITITAVQGELGTLGLP